MLGLLDEITRQHADILAAAVGEMTAPEQPPLPQQSRGALLLILLWRFCSLIVFELLLLLLLLLYSLPPITRKSPG